MSDEYDFIVVGSGAGGGPVAARLAMEGHRVLLLEAGGYASGRKYDVPGYHAAASQDSEMRWDYWVRHYESQTQQTRDSKYRALNPKPKTATNQSDAKKTEISKPSEKHPCGDLVDGVLYPRAAAVGGCTTHHALITIYPHDRDWEKLYELTGDSGWAPDNMRRYFSAFLENCEYLRSDHFAAKGHGFAAKEPEPTKNWLSTQMPDLQLLADDAQLRTVFISAVIRHLNLLQRKDVLSQQILDKLWQLKKAKSADELLQLLDPNNVGGISNGRAGVFFIPLSTKNRVRVGAREVIKAAEANSSGRLKIQTNACVTEIILEKDTDGNLTAAGVKFQIGKHLFGADPNSDQRPVKTELKEARAKREVILAAGTFNTPQLLMLSGIGPTDALKAHGIKQHVRLEGVGKNLHDRYEISVVSRMRQNFVVTDGWKLDPKVEDPQWRDWEPEKCRKGVYTSSGASLAIVRRSRPELEEPDLFIFGMPGYFRGYYPEYHNDIITDGTGKENNSVFTWAILKKSPTHLANRRGTVRLRSNSPFTPPCIEFNYFPDGLDDEDAKAMAEGIRFVRSLSEGDTTARDAVISELLPGSDKVSDTQLRQWVLDEAWGHHACGTCRIGPADEVEQGKDGRTPAVVDSQFRVHGVKRLRIVDGSVFSDIPGFFLATPIYMIAEKAADDILKSI